MGPGMNSDPDQTRAVAGRLRAAGIRPEQVELALRTSTDLLAVLDKAPADPDGPSVREVYAAVADAAAPDADAGQ